MGKNVIFILKLLFFYLWFSYSSILGAQKQNKGTETTTSTSKGGVLA
jgi:hypothetical protein